MRERERDRQTDRKREGVGREGGRELLLHLNCVVAVCPFLMVPWERERQTDRERERQRDRERKRKTRERERADCYTLIGMSLCVSSSWCNGLVHSLVVFPGHIHLPLDH